MKQEKFPSGYVVKFRGEKPEIHVKTIEERNEAVSWSDCLDKEGKPLLVGNFLIRVRMIEVDGVGKYGWQYGLLDDKGVLTKSPITYKSKEAAIGDGIFLARKEIQSAQKD